MRHVRGRVLDVGCGAGRVALYLQERGHEVVAIDVSPLAVQVCRLRGVEDARVMSITQIGPDLGSFDTIVMMGNNFGLFANARRARWLLRRFRASTEAHGRIVAESRDPHDTDDPAHLAYQRRNVERGRMPGQIRLRVRYRDLATPWFDYLMVSSREMEGLLEDTGWHLGRVIDTDGDLYVGVIDKVR